MKNIQQPAPTKLKKAPEFKELPDEITDAVEKLAKAYATSKIRPRLKRKVLKHWEQLLEDWIADKELPLLIRKGSKDFSKGKSQHHEATGRELISCDNSPAHWAFTTAFERGVTTDIAYVRKAIKQHQIPVAFIMSKDEVKLAKMQGTLTKNPSANVSKLKWRVDHLEEIGLNQKGSIRKIEIKALEKHFRLLMSPSNIILVPSALKGLGDMGIFLEQIKKETNELVSNQTSAVTVRPS